MCDVTSKRWTTIFEDTCSRFISRLSSQLLVNSANLKLMLIESVSSSINRIDYSRKLIGKVKVNAKISGGKIYGNAFDFNLDRKIFSLDLFG